MASSFLRLLSPQAVAIYQLLTNANPMTAKEIGEALHIFPHAAYRSIKQLIEFGFVQETQTYPKRFKVQATVDITFIQTREQLIDLTREDIARAEKSVNYIVSGHPVPAETTLTYKNAIDKGVKIRALIQTLHETSEAIFQSYQAIGIALRYYPNMEARIFIIDNKIVYFTSYNPQKNEEAIGLRFNYPPFAQIMNELFEQRWKLGKPIQKIDH